MSMQDPIADLLTRIRNAQGVAKETVDIPASTVKTAILNVMKDEGYIHGFETIEGEGKSKVQKTLRVALKYHKGLPVIEKIKRISKPGLRTYRGYKDLPQVIGGLGVAIISTSKGVMSDRQARAAKLGGEILVELW